MIRAGIVGTNTSHAGVFAGLLNGVDGAAPAVAGAEVVAVWSSGKEGLSGLHSEAPELARQFNISHVATDPAEMIGMIDLVLILDDLDGGALHPELARPFLDAGIPTYVDKPMALAVSDAATLFDRSDQTGAPLMSCSALRFADELATVGKDKLGDLSTVVSIGPGDWYNYGIHAVEAAVAVYGTGAQSVLQTHCADRDVTVINHADGPRLIIATLRDAQVPFHLTAVGARGIAETAVADYQSFYANTMRAAVRMAETGTSPIDRTVTLEVLSILAAGQRSAEVGGAVRLADILPEAVQ